ASRGHSPHSEDRVADELLYGAVVALDDGPRSLEIGRQQVADRLGVAGLGDWCEADHVGEQQRRRPPLRDRVGREAIALHGWRGSALAPRDRRPAFAAEPAATKRRTANRAG